MRLKINITERSNTMEAHLKHRFIRILPLVITLLLSWGIASFAEPGDNKKPENNGGQPWGHPKKNDVMQELNLTKEQQDKLAEYRKLSQEERKTTLSSLKDARSKLMTELDKSKSDPKEIERLSTEVKKFQNRLTDLHIKSIFQMKEVLTPDQFKKLREKAQEKHNKQNKKWSLFDKK